MTEQELQEHNDHIMYMQSIEEECAICNINYKEGDIIRKFEKCPHFFHYKCIDKWLDTNKNCPVCTVNVI